MEAKTDQIQQLRKIVDIALRRKILILGFILVATSIGLVMYLIQPKIYKSSCLLSFQKQKVNPAKMSPEVTGKISDVISTISQIVVSRTSLEKIIEDQDLYVKSRQSMPMQDIVENMRGNISIKPSKKGEIFSITFQLGDPNVVARVTNALAARFVEENLKYRQERATETSSYTQNELDMAKETLDKKEAILRDYKLSYYNEMPEQRQSNMARLNALQEQYQGKQESIQDLERTRVLIQDQIAARQQVLDNFKKRIEQLSPTPESKETIVSDQERLERFQAQLTSLKDKYTDKHPKIKILKRKLARLEKNIKEEAAKTSSLGKGGQGADEMIDKGLFALNLQLKEVKLQITKISQEREVLQKQIVKYEKWVAAAPVREAEWSAISREYGELKRHYDYLVAQNLQAKSAMNIERKQQGSQFKIEDAARVPMKPVEPDFLKIMGLAILLGAAAGGGLAFGIEFLDTSFRDPVNIENTYGVEVICTVPNLQLRREIIKKRVWNVVSTLIICIFSLSIVIVALYFWKKGHIIL